MTRKHVDLAQEAGAFIKKEYEKNERNLKHAIQRGDTDAVESLRKKQKVLSYIMEGKFEDAKIYL